MKEESHRGFFFVYQQFGIKYKRNNVANSNKQMSFRRMMFVSYAKRQIGSMVAFTVCAHITMKTIIFLERMGNDKMQTREFQPAEPFGSYFVLIAM